MRNHRKNYTPQEKVFILKRHLVDRIPVSDLCDQYNLQPTSQNKAEQKRIEQLETKLRNKNEVLSELMEEHVKLKKRTWGALTASWVPHDIRDAVINFVQRWTEKCGIAVTRFIEWLGIALSKYYHWENRYGKVNEHNARIPRDFWLEEWEKQTIITFHHQYPLEGYRRLTYMMLGRNIVAVSPCSVYRVLSAPAFFAD